MSDILFILASRKNQFLVIFKVMIYKREMKCNEKFTSIARCIFLHLWTALKFETIKSSDANRTLQNTLRNETLEDGKT